MAVATAINHHAAPEQGLVLAFHGSQHRHRIEHLGGITRRNVGALGNVRAHRQKDSIETARLFGFEHVVHLGVVLDAHTQIHDALHLGIKHLTRQAVLRNAKTHHAARQWPASSTATACTQARQLTPCRQTRRSGTDNHHLFAGTGQGPGKLPALGDGRHPKSARPS